MTLFDVQWSFKGGLLGAGLVLACFLVEWWVRRRLARRRVEATAGAGSTTRGNGGVNARPLPKERRRADVQAQAGKARLIARGEQNATARKRGGTEGRNRPAIEAIPEQQAAETEKSKAAVHAKRQVEIEAERVRREQAEAQQRREQGRHWAEAEADDDDPYGFDAYDTLVCDYIGRPPFADAAWANDPTMCQWCANTGHPYGHPAYGGCKCPGLSKNGEDFDDGRSAADARREIDISELAAGLDKLQAEIAKVDQGVGAESGRKAVTAPQGPDAYWWGYSQEHGWVVIDWTASKNAYEGGVVKRVRGYRCRDWQPITIERSFWQPPHCVYYKNYLASLTGQRKTEAESLLSLNQAEFPARTRGANLPPVPRKNWLDCYIAGFQHYQGGSVLSSLVPGEELVLRREPSNPYDSHAIEVLTQTGVKLGYIPQTCNTRVLAQLGRVSVRIKRVNPAAPLWEKVQVEILLNC
jgi:HIRAN domain